MKNEIAIGDLYYSQREGRHFEASTNYPLGEDQIIATAAQLKGLHDKTMKIVANCDCHACAAPKLVVGQIYRLGDMPIGATYETDGGSWTIGRYHHIEFADTKRRLLALPKESKQAEFQGSIYPPEADIGLTNKQRAEVAEMQYEVVKNLRKELDEIENRVFNKFKDLKDVL